MRRLFDPIRVHAGKLFASNDSVWQRPLLIRIEHDCGSLTGDASQTLRPFQITLKRTANLQFEGAESLVETTPYIVTNLIIVIVIPADAGVIAGITPIKNPHPHLTARLLIDKHLQSRL